MGGYPRRVGETKLCFAPEVKLRERNHEVMGCTKHPKTRPLLRRYEKRRSLWLPLCACTTCVTAVNEVNLVQKKGFDSRCAKKRGVS
jgi:hypothetical protein